MPQPQPALLSFETRSSCAHLHAQPETGHSVCCSNHSSRCAAWPPCRQCWHQTIQCEKDDETAPHASSGVELSAIDSPGGGGGGVAGGHAKGSGSGQPRCC